MIKPRKLKPGDKVAIVSLSWGGLGDAQLIHKYRIAKKRLEEDFGLQVTVMPHTLAGSGYVYEHPELRARDLNEAFLDNTVSAVFCAIGGDDTIRILPYVDFGAIRSNPKIFMGYSDSTINHLMMYKAGLVSFYGPSVMCEFGEYVKMNPYTESAVRNILFGSTCGYKIEPSGFWSDDYIKWDEANMNRAVSYRPDPHGYELLQGNGIVRGHLLGGCLDVFMMAVGTSVWPPLDEWRGAILFIETSEDKPSSDFVRWTLRSLAAQGILGVINAIIVGKPMGEVYYEEYKAAIIGVVSGEEHLYDLPVLYNVNFGHAAPIGIIPYGINAELNCADKTLTLLESVTEE